MSAQLKIPFEPQAELGLLAVNIAQRMRAAGFTAELSMSKVPHITKFGNQRIVHAPPTTRYVTVHTEWRSYQIRISDHPQRFNSRRFYGAPDLDLVLPLPDAYIEATVSSFMKWIVR